VREEEFLREALTRALKLAQKVSIGLRSGD